MIIKFEHPEEGIVYMKREFGSPLRGLEYKRIIPSNILFIIEDMKIAIDRR